MAIVVMMLDALYKILLELSGEELAGPIGVAQMAGEVAQMGFVPLLNFAAFLSLNLGIVNLFPIPALDGGYILFILVEMITGRKPSDKFLGIANTIGFVLLFALLIYANGMDIFRALR